MEMQNKHNIHDKIFIKTNIIFVIGVYLFKILSYIADICFVSANKELTIVRNNYEMYHYCQEIIKDSINLSDEYQILNVVSMDITLYLILIIALIISNCWLIRKYNISYIKCGFSIIINTTIFVLSYLALYLLTIMILNPMIVIVTLNGNIYDRNSFRHFYIYLIPLIVCIYFMIHTIYISKSDLKHQLKKYAILIAIAASYIVLIEVIYSFSWKKEYCLLRTFDSSQDIPGIYSYFYESFDISVALLINSITTLKFNKYLMSVKKDE